MMQIDHCSDGKPNHLNRGQQFSEFRLPRSSRMKTTRLSIGRRVLEKAFQDSVNAIEARNAAARERAA